MSLLLADDLKDDTILQMEWHLPVTRLSSLAKTKREGMTFAEMEARDIEQERRTQALNSIGAVLL